MAKTPKKAWMKQEPQGEIKPMSNYPFLHQDAESVRLRAVIRGAQTEEE